MQPPGEPHGQRDAYDLASAGEEQLAVVRGAAEDQGAAQRGAVVAEEAQAPDDAEGQQGAAMSLKGLGEEVSSSIWH